MKQFIVSFFLIFSCTASFAQITIVEFIRSAQHDPKVKVFDDQLVYLQTKPYRLSPLQKTEFRTQNREMLSYQQEYALRFTPANPWEIRNNNLYFQNYQSSLTLEKELALKNALADRYNTLIFYLYYSEIKLLSDEKQKLLNNQLSVLEKQSSSSFFDADKYVKLKVDVIEKSVDSEEIEFELSNWRNQINSLYPDGFRKEISWTVENIVSPERIGMIVDSLTGASYSSAWLAYQQQKINLANSEYKLEKANINIGFLQTEYDHRRVEQDRNPVNISLGITIPITNPNKGDMAKRRLDAIEAEYDLKEAQSESQTDKEITLEKLTRALERYHDLQKRINELAQSNLGGQLSLIKGGDPMALIRFNESIIKLKELQAKQRKNILLTYIEYLALTDKLQQKPLINFLSDDLKEIGW